MSYNGVTKSGRSTIFQRKLPGSHLIDTVNIMGLLKIYKLNSSKIQYEIVTS